MEGIDPSIIVAQLGFIEAIGCAVVGGIFAIVLKVIESKRDRERQADQKTAEEQRQADLDYRAERERMEAAYKAERERKDAEKAEYEAAKLDLLFATANGCDVLLQAAHGDDMNGNVDAARTSISNAKSDCNHIVNRQAVKRIGENS